MIKHSKFLFYLLLVIGFAACSPVESTAVTNTNESTSNNETANDTIAVDEPLVDSSDSFCNTEGVANQSADASIEQLRQAMLTFRSALSDTLLTEATNCLDDERFYLWHNTPNDRNNRDGITYGDLSDEQLVLFQDLLQQFLSDSGYQKIDEVITLAEGYLSTIDDGVWNIDFYSIDMFGDPENSGSWGFQLDGHHTAVNFLVHGDSVSIVPAFIGAEPVIGSYDGTDFDVFSIERDLAFTLFNNLSNDENSAATSTGGGTAMVLGPAERAGQPDPYIGEYDYSGFETGLKYSDMSAATQANVTALMQAYVYNLETQFADVWWEDVMAAIDDTYFVWIGDTETLTTTSIYYYRIYNPHVWVEYNVEGMVGANIEAGNHAHSITRIPSTSDGGDYGIFANVINQSGPRTLLEHYIAANHHALSEIHFDYTVTGTFDHDHHSISGEQS